MMFFILELGKMGKRVTNEEKEKIRELIEEGLSIREIAERVGIKYVTARIYIKAYEEGFSSPTEYLKHLLKKRGFSSLTEYEKHNAKKRGYSFDQKYREKWARQKGYASFREYQEKWVERKGFNSEYEYNKYRMEQLQQRREYKKLEILIKNKLEELGRNQRWLAKELGITPQAVNLYVHGKAFPSERILEKLDRVLLMSKDDLEGRVNGGKE